VKWLIKLDNIFVFATQIIYWMVACFVAGKIVEYSVKKIVHKNYQDNKRLLWYTHISFLPIATRLSCMNYSLPFTVHKTLWATYSRRFKSYNSEISIFIRLNDGV